MAGQSPRCPWQLSVLIGLVTVVRIATHFEKVAASLSSLFFHSPQKRTEVGGAGYVWARRVRRPAEERSVMPMCPGQLGGRAKTLAVTIDKSEKGGRSRVGINGSRQLLKD